MTPIKTQPSESETERRELSANVTGPVPIVEFQSQRSKDVRTTGSVVEIKTDVAR